jgi:hypothetical protein
MTAPSTSSPADQTPGPSTPSNDAELDRLLAQVAELEARHPVGEFQGGIRERKG